MAKHISSLNVVLGATVAPFVSAFGSLKGIVNNFTSSIGSASSTLLKFTGVGAAIGAIAGGAGLGLLLHNQLEAIDSTAKLSDRLGISTESLTGFQHAASLAGVSNEQLSGGLEKMLKNLGEAAAGSDTAKAAFQSLGLNATDLANIPTDQAFEKISDALKAIQNPAQRAAAAVAVFGKSGQELLPLLLQGSEGIKAAIKEADALGLSFNRIDAAKVEEANDAVRRMQSAVTGVVRSITIALAPFLTTAANAATSLGIKLVAAVKTYLPVVVSAIGQAINFVTPFVTTAASIVTSVFGYLYGKAASIWSAIYNAVAPIVSSIYNVIARNWNAIASTTASIFDTVYGAVAAVANSIYGTIANNWSAIAAVTASAWNAIYGIVSPVINAVYSFITSNWNAIVTNTVAAWNYIAGAVSAAASGIWSGLQPIIAVAQGIAQAVANAFTSLLGVIGQVGSAVGSALPSFASLKTIFEDITLAAGALAAGYIILQGVHYTIAASTAVVTAATEIATAAQWLWNAALAANPIGLAVLGIVALSTAIAGLGAYIASTNGSFDNFGGFIGWVKTQCLELAYAATHLGDTWQLVSTDMELAVVRFANQTAYFFTEVIPATAIWFANNWRDIFTTVFNWTTTVFGNLASNIVNIISNIPGLISGSVSFSDLWTPLTDGFESSLKELPKIAERQAGPLEDSLQHQADALRESYGKGLGDYLAEHQQKVADSVKAATDAIKPAEIPAPKIDPPKVDIPKIGAPQIEPIDTKPIDNVKKHAKDAAASLDLLTTGSAEALKATYEAKFPKLKENTNTAPDAVASAIPNTEPLPSSARQGLVNKTDDKIANIQTQMLQLVQALANNVERFRRQDESNSTNIQVAEF